MKKTANKIGLIGSGAVGTSFLYAAINQGIASNYVLIDAFGNVAEGNALDLADTRALISDAFTSIQAGDYADLKDADLIVITAGKPRSADQTRLDIVGQNALIMHEIGMKVKASGFEGITLIASNPVDVLTLIYQEATGFAAHKVIGSSTNLDSARLKRLLGEKLDLSPNSVETYLLGEHGDSAVGIWSQASILGQPLNEYLITQNLTLDLPALRDEAMSLGSKIIGLKRATFYGIGTALTKIAKAVLNDEKLVLVVGVKPTGEYQMDGVYLGLPAIVGQNGWEKILEWKISGSENELLQHSYQVLKQTATNARESIQKSLIKA